MVFSSLRRYFSMRQQSSKVQALYDHCKTILAPSGSGTLPPSSKALMKLSSILGMSLLLFSTFKCKDMDFSSLRRYFSMRQQSSKVQALYDHCKTILSPSGSGTPPPSSQALMKLSSILDTIQPADAGLEEKTADDDANDTIQPITYVDIHECDSFTMCIFCFPTSSVIPLHDHPGMTVFSKLLYGSLHVKAYDWVEPPCIIESKGPGYGQGLTLRLAKLAVDKVLNAPCDTSVLYPKHGGNLHCFTAVTPCAMLDILTPPYREEEGRMCTLYHDYPYSAFSAGNAPIRDREEEEYVWLAELESPSDLYMQQGVYAGPAIQL